MFLGVVTHLSFSSFYLEKNNIMSKKTHKKLSELLCYNCLKNRAEAMCIYCTECREKLSKKEIKSKFL